MKCAMELMEIGAMNAARIEKEKKEEERRRVEKMALYTKQWCEEVVSSLLEKSVEEGDVCPSCALWFTGRRDSTIVQYLNRAISLYADNRIEACVASENIHIPTLKEYLAQFCYQLEPYCSRDYWSYGCGEHDGYEWHVTVSPSCAQ